MPDHILQVTVRADDLHQYFIDLVVGLETYAVLGPYEICPTEQEAQAAAFAAVRMDGYTANSPLIWIPET